MMESSPDFGQTIPAALDLCIKNKPKKRPAFPDYNNVSSYENPEKKRPTSYVDAQTCQYSPVSNSDSETSEISTEMNKVHHHHQYSPSSFPPKSKPTRPFKAYLKDPFNLAVGLATSASQNSPLGLDSSVGAFTKFRETILSQVQSPNNGTNKNMRRVPQNAQNHSDDPSYWEKRRKNNEAAKRSRDARRAKEDEIAIRCAFLERENIELKFRIATLEAERRQMRMQDVYHP